ncbi:MAG: OmpA family protein [Bdellovibrionales bacterium]
MIRRLIFSFVLLSAASAWSVERNMLTLRPDLQRGDLYKPQGLWPLLGVGLGIMDYNDQIRTGGVTNQVKVMGSYYFDDTPWVADAGIGLHSEFLTQKGQGSDTIHSFYTEFSGRYQLSHKWQLGAIWNTLIDNPDRYRSNTENLASFVGFQALKEFVYDDSYLVRAGGRVMTDVGISGEMIDTVMAEVQVSFGSSAKPIVENKPEPKAVAPHLASQAIKTFQFSDPGPVHFDTDSTQLVPRSKTYFRRLAQVLADNHHLFERIEVIGHADQRGADDYNRRLSLRRAQSVTNALTLAGVGSFQVRPSGRGESELLNRSMDPDALQRNRRVQLEFHGVKNREALQKLLDSVPR